MKSIIKKIIAIMIALIVLTSSFFVYKSVTYIPYQTGILETSFHGEVLLKTISLNQEFKNKNVKIDIYVSKVLADGFFLNNYGAEILSTNSKNNNFIIREYIGSYDYISESNDVLFYSGGDMTITWIATSN